jgi:hypothetical protein
MVRCRQLEIPVIPTEIISRRGAPSAHTSTLAAERRPSSRKGIDRRRHAAAGAKPCVSGWGESFPPLTGRNYQPNRRSEFKTLSASHFRLWPTTA